MTRLKLYLLPLVLLTIITVNSQLLAIDFGTQFIKASVVHSGAGKSFSIVENSKSERKFLNAVFFYSYSLVGLLQLRTILLVRCFEQKNQTARKLFLVFQNVDRFCTKSITRQNHQKRPLFGVCEWKPRWSVLGRIRSQGIPWGNKRTHFTRSNDNDLEICQTRSIKICKGFSQGCSSHPAQLLVNPPKKFPSPSCSSRWHLRLINY